jgi:hypothetical protein
MSDRKERVARATRAGRAPALVLALLLLAGCKRCGKSGGDVAPATALHVDAGEVTFGDASVPEGDLRGEAFSFTLAVYHFAAAPPAAQGEMRKLLTGAGVALSSVPLTSPPKETTAAIMTPSSSTFAPRPSIRFAIAGERCPTTRRPPFNLRLA